MFDKGFFMLNLRPDEIKYEEVKILARKYETAKELYIMELLTYVTYLN